VEEAGEHLVGKGTAKASEQFLRKTATETGGRAAERASKIGGEQVLKHAEAEVFNRAGRVMKRSNDRPFKNIFVDCFPWNAGARSGKRRTEKVFNFGGEWMRKRLVFGPKSRSVGAGTKIIGETSEQMVVRSTENAMMKAGTRSGEEMAANIARKGSTRAMSRVGKGMMIAIPAVGALFATYLMKSDLERIHEEWNRRIAASSLLFVGAGLADLIDMLIHFFIVFGLLLHGDRHKLVVAEEISMLCAVVSTVCAVAGEVMSSRIRRRRSDLSSKAAS